jgi:FlaA1/EpsC-like NDP-sugar epimerase
VEIVFTGLRPGEKMFEELVIGQGLRRSPHPGVFVAEEGHEPWASLEVRLQRLEAAVSQHDAAEVRRLVIGETAGAGSRIEA